MTKAWTLPWTRLVLAVGAVVVVVPAAFAGVPVRVFSGGGTGGAVWESLGLYVLVDLFIVLGAVVVGSDLRTGELRLGMAAVPGRLRLATAKLTALAVLAVTAGAVLVVVDRVIRIWTDPGAGLLSEPGDVVRTVLGVVVAGFAFTFLAAALTVLVRSVMVAVAVLVLAQFLIVPLLEGPASAVTAVLPYNARTTVIDGVGGNAIPVAAGFALLLAWAAVSAVVYVLTLRSTDS